MAFNKPLYLLFLAYLCFGCSDNTHQSNLNYLDLTSLKPAIELNYAKRFSVAENEQCVAVFLFGATNEKDTSAIYILPKDSSFKISCRPKEYVVNDAGRLISLSSVYTNMIALLGEEKRIVAIENVDYYSEENILHDVAEKKIVEVNKNPEPDVESILLLNPDVIFSFGSVNSSRWPDSRITNAGIPTLVAFDHLEENPLARAEWIKLFGVFLNKTQQADSIFNTVEKNYQSLRSLASNVKSRPTVFSEIKTGDLWYVPGGKSFAATFLKDAGAKYVWENDAHSGSLPLDLETVYAKAGTADVWINLPLVKSKAELAALDKRYTDFKAFKAGALYNNTKHLNLKGYSTYWETGIIFPDRILSDLISIFHPELRSDSNNVMYYYTQMK